MNLGGGRGVVPEVEDPTRGDSQGARKLEGVSRGICRWPGGGPAGLKSPCESSQSSAM